MCNFAYRIYRAKENSFSMIWNAISQFQNQGQLSHVKYSKVKVLCNIDGVNLLKISEIGNKSNLILIKTIILF